MQIILNGTETAEGFGLKNEAYFLNQMRNTKKGTHNLLFQTNLGFYENATVWSFNDQFPASIMFTSSYDSYNLFNNKAKKDGITNINSTLYNKQNIFVFLSLWVCGTQIRTKF